MAPANFKALKGENTDPNKMPSSGIIINAVSNAIKSQIEKALSGA